jgi:P27 family predicted phage terminase small subunit
MGKRGPLPKRTATGSAYIAAKQAADAEHRQHDPDKLLAIPRGLTSGAKRRWQSLAPLLLADKRLRPDTREALAVYVRLADEQETLSEQLATEGAILSGPHGNYANPRAKVLQGVRSQMLRFGAVLGLDPAARARLESAGIIDATTKTPDELEADQILFG